MLQRVEAEPHHARPRAARRPRRTRRTPRATSSVGLQPLVAAVSSLASRMSVHPAAAAPRPPRSGTPRRWGLHSRPRRRSRSTASSCVAAAASSLRARSPAPTRPPRAPRSRVRFRAATIAPPLRAALRRARTTSTACSPAAIGGGSAWFRAHQAALLVRIVELNRRAGAACSIPAAERQRAAQLEQAQAPEARERPARRQMARAPPRQRRDRLGIVAPRSSIQRLGYTRGSRAGRPRQPSIEVTPQAFEQQQPRPLRVARARPARARPRARPTRRRRPRGSAPRSCARSGWGISASTLPARVAHRRCRRLRAVRVAPGNARRSRRPRPHSGAAPGRRGDGPATRPGSREVKRPSPCATGSGSDRARLESAGEHAARLVHPRRTPSAHSSRCDPACGCVPAPARCPTRPAPGRPRPAPGRRCRSRAPACRGRPPRPAPRISGSLAASAPARTRSWYENPPGRRYAWKSRSSGAGRVHRKISAAEPDALPARGHSPPRSCTPGNCTTATARSALHVTRARSRAARAAPRAAARSSSTAPLDASRRPAAGRGSRHAPPRVPIGQASSERSRAAWNRRAARSGATSNTIAGRSLKSAAPARGSRARRDRPRRRARARAPQRQHHLGQRHRQPAVRHVVRGARPAALGGQHRELLQPRLARQVERRRRARRLHPAPRARRRSPVSSSRGSPTSTRKSPRARARPRRRGGRTRTRLRTSRSATAGIASRRRSGCRG